MLIKQGVTDRQRHIIDTTQSQTPNPNGFSLPHQHREPVLKNVTLSDCIRAFRHFLLTNGSADIPTWWHQEHRSFAGNDDTNKPLGSRHSWFAREARHCVLHEKKAPAVTDSHLLQRRDVWRSAPRRQETSTFFQASQRINC